MAGGGIPRPTARVILIDASERVLLMQYRGEDVPFIWATPGGGLEPGETPEQAAVRELYEEVGLRDAALGPCVWLRNLSFRWQGKLHEFQEQYFVCNIEAHEVGDHVNHDEWERDAVVDLRWWSVSEIAAGEEVFAPRSLAALLPPILRGEYPDEPFEVGV
jgi:8-oxo-dGTP pyrophosphatase MutT (NUDIX family)